MESEGGGSMVHTRDIRKRSRGKRKKMDVNDEEFNGFELQVEDIHPSGLLREEWSYRIFVVGSI